MTSIDDFSDEEIGRMIKQAARDRGWVTVERISSRQAFCSFLRGVGLGRIADAIEVALYAWQRVQSIWKSIFG